MIDGKPFAMFFNGSPRKGWNTDRMLQSAQAGAEEIGAATELVHLYDIDYKGCKSCFACKVKNSRTNGVCAIRDGLRPILQRARQADVLVIGSPVYYNQPTGMVRSFIERLAFPVGTYLWKDGRQVVLRDKVIETAMIYTMNCPVDWLERFNYPLFLEDTANTMKAIFGECETLLSCNTYQFKDYSRYDFNLFTEEEKRAHRDRQFPVDLRNARELGKRLVERAIGKTTTSNNL